jgi:hypothetical protein
LKKEKETKNQKKIINSEKRKKEKIHTKKPTRRFNGPAQHHAHAGGAEFRSANERSIEFTGAPMLRLKARAKNAPLAGMPNWAGPGRNFCSILFSFMFFSVFFSEI